MSEKTLGSFVVLYCSCKMLKALGDVCMRIVTLVARKTVQMTGLNNVIVSTVLARGTDVQLVKQICRDVMYRVGQHIL